MVEGGRWTVGRRARCEKYTGGTYNTDQTPPRKFERHGSIQKDGQMRSGRIKEYRAIEDGRIEEDGGIEGNYRMKYGRMEEAGSIKKHGSISVLPGLHHLSVHRRGSLFDYTSL